MVGKGAVHGRGKKQFGLGRSSAGHHFEEPLAALGSVLRQGRQPLDTAPGNPTVLIFINIFKA